MANRGLYGCGVGIPENPRDALDHSRRPNAQATATYFDPTPGIRTRVLGRNIEAARVVTAIGTNDIVTTATNHGYASGDRVRFNSLTGGTGLTNGQDYFVVAANLTATTFSVSATRGGAVVDVTVAYTGGAVTRLLDNIIGDRRSDKTGNPNVPPVPGPYPRF